MGRTELQKEKRAERGSSTNITSSKGQNRTYDAALTTLFTNSFGPVKLIARSIAQSASSSEEAKSANSIRSLNKAKVVEQDALSETSNEQVQEDLPQLRYPDAEGIRSSEERVPNRKRKRKDVEDDLEVKYMNELAKLQLKEDEQEARRAQKKRRKPLYSDNIDGVGAPLVAADVFASDNVGTGTGDEEGSSTGGLPQHESIFNLIEDIDFEKSSRTVFLGNVSTMAIKSKTAKKTLMDHLVSFTSMLPKQDVKHGIESLRFRSTAFASTGIPRKAAFAKKELMDTTTKSTNAYAVYATQLAAREAVQRLNGTMVLDRHLRVDSVAHPAKIDHRRCVFVGNLGFVDDTTSMNAVEDGDNNKRPRRAKEPADVEEGLWNQFGKVGTVESVRVIRDKTTRVGKGFAYVQFENANTVEAALLYNWKKFPPMLPRVLRVARARNMEKASGHKIRGATFKRKNDLAATYKPKVPSGMQSLTGRAGKLHGRAGTAQLRAAGEKPDLRNRKINGIIETPESVVFEGYRASSHQEKRILRSRSSGKKHGKPSVRSRKFKVQSKKKAGL